MRVEEEVNDNDEEDPTVVQQSVVSRHPGGAEAQHSHPLVLTPTVRGKVSPPAFE